MQVVFTAETGALSAQLSRISGQLTSLSGVAAVADAGIRNLAGALDFGVEGLTGGAFSAGAQLGAAFAAGISSMSGSAAQAAAYLSASAMSALKGSYSSGGSSVGASVSGMDSSALSGSAGSSNLRNQGKEVVIPINVDGVKLGEACIKALDKVAGMTGRARLSI